MNKTLNCHPAAPDPVAFDVRIQRVLELRRQLADGTYQIDPAAVAVALLREHMALEGALAPLALASPATVPTIGDFSRFVVATASSAPAEELSVMATA